MRSNVQYGQQEMQEQGHNGGQGDSNTRKYCPPNTAKGPGLCASGGVEKEGQTLTSKMEASGSTHICFPKVTIPLRREALF